MGEVEMGSSLKRMLQSLCCSSGWSYGVFWSFDKQNSMLLTLKDAYYEDQMAAVVANMLQQVHILGEGIIGEVVSTGNQKWMLFDAHAGEWNSLSISKDVFQDDSDFHVQFASGIQTIALVPVESQGVLQFGSMQKIVENLGFLDQARILFQEMENFDGLIQLEDKPQSLSGDYYDLNAIFATLMSPGNSFAEGDNYKELMENPCSLVDLCQSSTFATENDYGRNTPFHINSSYNYNQPQTAGQAVPVFSPCNPDTLCQQGFLQSSCFVKDSSAHTSCMSTWSDESSILTSFEQPFPSESVIQMSMFTSMNRTEGLVDKASTFPLRSGEMMEDKFSAKLFLETEGGLPEIADNRHRLTAEFNLSGFATDLTSSYAMDDRSQRFSPSLRHTFHRMGTTFCNNLLQSGGAPISSSVTAVNPIQHPSNSPQSSITNAFIAKEQAKKATNHGVENDLFDGWGQNSGCAQTGAGGCKEDCMEPGVSGRHSALSNCMSECITELDVGSVAVPGRRLFSELGIEEFIHNGTSSSTLTKGLLEDQFSITKRRKVESIDLVQAVHKQDWNNRSCKQDVLRKSPVGLWIDDSYNIYSEKAVAASVQKPEKHTKVSRKRARPSENTKPRPKDRQQIQDRLKELRGIIPNGVKCSIDCLLDLTIKHMLFLQSITQYADKIKEAEEPKLLHNEKGVALRGNTESTNGSGSATWACEIEGPTMSCPIKVQDLGTPSQMLIEMLCEDRGLFLEIADLIRGFGLNIWKGVMERREDKIWAHFVVERNKNIQQVTRLDIMLSLIRLQQQTNMKGKDLVNQPSHAIDDRIPLLHSCQRFLLPIS